MNLAGSALSMDVAVAKTTRFTGLSLDEVLPMASTIPANYIGIATSGRLLCQWDGSAGKLEVLRIIETS